MVSVESLVIAAVNLYNAYIWIRFGTVDAMKQLRVLIVVVVVFMSGYAAGLQHRTGPAAAQDGTDLDQLFVPFWEAWNVVNTRYVDTLDPEMLMIGALSGMVNAIGDENTSYMSAEELASWNTELGGQFEGIGATVEKDEA